MKKLLAITIFLLAPLLFALAGPLNAQADGQATLFYGEGCPHCAQVEDYLKQHGLEDSIQEKEIYHNPQNAQEFNQICDEARIDLMDRGVPFLYTDSGDCLVGDSQIISYFKSQTENGAVSGAQNEKPETKNLTILILTGAALVDAINPCAFAVLLILITTVLASGNKKRALASGLAFSASIFISYFLMGLGLYSVVASIKTAQLFIKTIAVLAIIIGLFNLKDFFWYGKGFLMEVPMSWRPRLKKIISSVISPPGAFLIGFLVSLFLLPCTSGPYIVIIGMLGQKATYARAVWLLLLYNLIFILPMIAISLLAYFGMDVKKAEEKRIKNLRILHLIAGLIMLAMGAYLLFGNI